MTTIKLDVTELLPAAGDVARVSSRLGEVVVRGVNQAAAGIRTSTVNDIVAQVNLPRAYVDARVTLKSSATEQTPKAVLASPVRGTLLTRFTTTYGRTVLNAWNESRYKREFGSLDALVRPRPSADKLPWTPRRGRLAVGIPVGRKGNGVATAVKRAGGSYTLKHAFLMPLRNSNGLGVFARRAAGGKAKALYGPSVYQLANRQWRDTTEDLARRLGEAVSTELDKLGIAK